MEDGPLRWPPYDCEGGALVHLVGTAHLSKASCAKVSEVIRKVQPAVVCVELCKERRGLLQEDSETIRSQKGSILGVLGGGKNVFEGQYSCFLDRAGRDLEAAPGEEFRVALREARNCGAKFCFADRPVSVTVQRVWTALSFFGKVKLAYFLIKASFSFDGTEEDDLNACVEDKEVMSDLISAFAKEFPELVRPLIIERDLYMTHQLRAISEQLSPVVAVVGAGHLPGIRESWEKEIEIDEISRPRPLPAHRAMTTGPAICLCLAAAAVLGGVLVRYKTSIS